MARTRLLLVAVALVLLVSGCGTHSSSAGAGPAPSSPGSATPAPASHPTPGRYVALGDSYTSGPEIPVTRYANGCYRSTHNYPALVAAARHIKDLTDVSCSGATTADVFSAQSAHVPPQLDAVGRRTRLVTIGLGGNDLGVFTKLVIGCVELARQHPDGSPCSKAFADNGVLAKLGQIRVNLTRVIKAVHAKAPRARVLAVGYPQLVPASGTCKALPFATGDYPFARTLNHRLDQEIRQAARATGSTYVDVWSASAGHDVCSSAPWVNGGRLLPGRAAPFHPFEVEQQAVARLVLRATRR